MSNLELTKFDLDADNLTDVEKTMRDIILLYGQQVGKDIAERISSGELKVIKNVPLPLEIDRLEMDNLTQFQKILAQIGSPQFAVKGNLAFASGGIAISGVSTLKCWKTKNIVARFFYVTSTVCGGTAAIAGCLKAASNTAGLSPIAVGGDVVGGACLFIGHRAQQLGDMIDGKKSWWKPKDFLKRRPSVKSVGGYRGISFVSSYSSWEDVEQIVHNIPYKRIFIIGGTVFTIYGYIKFIVTVYNYLKSKFYTRINNSSSIHNSALFLIESLKKTNSIKTIDRIYLAALQLQYSPQLTK